VVSFEHKPCIILVEIDYICSCDETL